MGEATAGRRPTFGPVVLLGLAAGALAAVAGARAWVGSSAVSVGEQGQGSVGSSLALESTGEMPLAAALALVLLACWGVVLVTRRGLRRAVAALALLTAVGLLVTTLVGLVTLPDQFSDALAASGPVVDEVNVDRTGWGWAALVAAVASVPLTLLAVRDVPGWPEMGGRYDAPAHSGPAGDDAAGHRPAEDASAPEGNLEMWKAIDEGRDPTT